MLQSSGATSYMGCIGKDKYGEEMKKNAESFGVNVYTFNNLFSVIATSFAFKLSYIYLYD
jgi:sugar/nucleoside kinase (ribokinase family)